MNTKNKKTAFLIAAPSSGCGKTTIVLTIMKALMKRDLKVQPFKAGPDYLDTVHHKKICQRPSYNLDIMMTGEKTAKETFQRLLENVDAAVIEGVMGLFDGAGTEGRGSSADLAVALDVPVILVVDVSKTSKSAAALLYGFENFDKRLKIAGVILNFLGSPRHEKLVREAIKKHCKTEIVGAVYRNKNLKIKERYLGLASEENQPVLSEVEEIESQIDSDRILSLCQIEHEAESSSANLNLKQKSKKIKIAAALDKAFYFYYEENFDILKRAGAELVFFSPLKDKALPAKTDAIYIGGGYPELFAKELSENRPLLKQIKEASENGMPLYAECGGLMLLGSELVTLENEAFQMCGVFSFITKMSRKREALGYRKIIAGKTSPFLREGEEITGHEFRYSAIENIKDTDCVYRVFKDDEFTTQEGYLSRNTLASYIHLHFGGNISFADGFFKRG